MIALLAALVAFTPQAPPAPTVEFVPRTGTWRAWLECPGGELPFGLELARGAEGWNATIVNGPERIEVPEVRVADGRVALALPWYAATLAATVEEGGERIDGAWTRTSLGGTTSRLVFRAEHWSEVGAPPRFAPLDLDPAGSVAGRWRARFESSDDDAIALLEQAPDGRVSGTFLTTTGDYRFLAGSLEGRRLRLSAFDGAHAFLFDATLGDDGALAGRFFSREVWQETWSAVRDEEAALEDAWRQVEPRPGVPLELVRFPDALDSQSEVLFALSSAALTGRPAVIEIFGSWCPNCHDAGTWLAALRERVGPKRLALVGIAFEFTEDRERTRVQLRRYVERHGLERAYDDLLFGGIADKRRASEALPLLSAVKAFPTLVLVDRAGRVRSVYTGFSGPATGAAHERETAELERRILALVEEPAPDLEPDPPHAAPLLSDLWREEPSQRLWSFEAGGPFEVREPYRFGEPPVEKPFAYGVWWLVGDTLVVDGRRFAYDRRAGALLDPTDAGLRLRPAARPPVAVVDGVALDATEGVVAALSGSDPLARREALYFLALERVLAAQIPPEHRPPPGPRDALTLDLARALADPDALVRTTAAWAAGALGDAAAREPLRESLADGWAPLRREAARALGRLGPKEADRVALEALTTDADRGVRAAAREALTPSDR